MMKIKALLLRAAPVALVLSFLVGAPAYAQGVPPGSQHLPPGSYTCHFPASPADDGQLVIGGGMGAAWWNGVPPGPTWQINPPPGYERPDGKLLYFYPPNVVLLVDPANPGVAYLGTYTSP